jgi:shikimate 5-dehydrogenase
VNTTPVGMYPNAGETPFQGPFDGRLVYDLVYNPADTRLLKDAAAAGCQTIGGLDMLVAQAEDQSEWWLGRRPPANLMREAALTSL